MNGAPVFHNMDAHHAQEYGVFEALVINRMRLWIEYNQDRGKNLHENRTWTYGTYEQIAEDMFYFSPSQLKRIIKSLVGLGVLIEGNFNKIPYDRTKWYAFNEEAAFIRLSSQNGPNRQTKSSDRSDQIVQPIPIKEQVNTVTPPLEADAIKVLDHLNARAGRAYRPVAANLNPIYARIKEGATVEEIQRVIDVKCAEWLGDNKMSKYLRPETLFNAVKYQSYVGALDEAGPGNVFAGVL